MRKKESEKERSETDSTERIKAFESNCYYVY